MTIPDGFSQIPGGFYVKEDASGPYWLDTYGTIRSFEAIGEQLGGTNIRMFRNPSTTRQTVYYPSGALAVALSYRLLPGATAVASQFLRYVVNAYSDADADGKLATDNAYEIICQGDDKRFGAISTSAITRIDFLTSQAVGAEVTLFTITASVQS